MAPHEDQLSAGVRGPIEALTASGLRALTGDAATLPGPGGLGVRLAARLRELIRAGGALRPGTVLPPTRAVAAEFGLSRGVVVAAYEQLAAEGFLAGRQGSGTRVADLGAGARPAPKAPPPEEAARPGVPDLGGFPRGRWLAAYRQALTAMADGELGYGDPRGHARLRTELAAHLRAFRGADASPDGLLVVGGAADGLTLLADTLAAGGRPRIAVEDPSSPRTRALLRRRGLEVTGVPVDGEGLAVDALREPGRLGAVLLTPAHQYPAGVPLSAGRRQALVRLAREHGVLLIEDDYNGAFRYDREPPGCLQGLAPDVTALLGSVSKTLAPALRLGWLLAPPAWAPRLVHDRALTHPTGHTLDHLAFGHLLHTGDYTAHLRRTRRRYQSRRLHLTTELAAAAPGFTPLGIPGGLHLPVALPPWSREAEVLAAVRAEGYDVQGLGACALTPPPPDRPGGGLVIGFAALTPAAITHLVGVARAAGGPPPSPGAPPPPG
ncbi:PLP-dependent aminotransferase family protein [Streptomyces albidoflavus]|uniref:aminotransferase-like domain-containing protein n=1 Tax=Streptomyces albidoflavus TaxID=1886 RepID=UPI00259BE27C|nr:PLP-dependent aminotransferase family protein [Streptomyces albidoflavus]WJK68995.1 PLP-dependent aminotransferase family protein [Streptomyces albidoflavus]